MEDKRRKYQKPEIKQVLLNAAEAVFACACRSSDDNPY